METYLMPDVNLESKATIACLHWRSFIFYTAKREEKIKPSSFGIFFLQQYPQNATPIACFYMKMSL